MYRGVAAPIPCGAGSFNGAENVNIIPITDLIRARNITPERGSWGKSPGGAAYDSVAVSGAPNLIAAHDWNPDGLTQKIVSVWGDGKIYKESAGDIDAVTLKTLATVGKMGMFVTGGAESTGNNRKLFWFSESDLPQVLSGDSATMTAITTPSADWTGTNQPFGATPFEGRIAAWGNPNYKHGIYLSTATNHEDYTGSGSALYKIYPGEGERIVAALAFLQFRLYVWKYPRGLYYVDTTTSVTSPQITKVRDDVGAAGPGCVVRAGNDVVFIDSDGTLRSLRAAETSEDLKDSDITAGFNLESWTKDQVDASRLFRTRAVYFGQKKQVWVGVTSKGSSGGASGSAVNDRLFVLDATQESPRVYWDDRAPAYEGLFVRRDTDGIEKPAGGKLGKIILFDRVNRNVDGSAYNGEFQIPDTDFGYFDPELAKRDKRFDYLEITITPTGSYNMAFDIYIDGRKTQTILMSLGSSGGSLGSFVLGTDRFGGRSVTNHKARISGRGRFFGLRGYNTGLNEDFSISRILVHFKPLGKGGTK